MSTDTGGSSYSFFHNSFHKEALTSHYSSIGPTQPSSANRFIIGYILWHAWGSSIEKFRDEFIREKREEILLNMQEHPSRILLQDYRKNTISKPPQMLLAMERFT